jgi:hypothetical protein
MHEEDMPEPETMFAVVQVDTKTEPLAFFPVERTAWNWLFMKYGENDNFTVLPYLVSAIPE